MDGKENFLTSFAAYAYGSDADGKIILDGRGPIWESESGAVWVESAVAFDTENPAGYWMVNTGNPTRDAIATIAMNELGADNFKRAADNFGDGNYISAAREALFGVAELGLSLTGIGKLGQATVRSPRAFKAARAVAGQSRGARGMATGRFGAGAGRFGTNQPGGFLNRTRTALFGGQYVDPKVLNRAGNPALQTRPNAYRAVVNRYRQHGLGIRGSQGLIRGTVRSTAKAIRSGARAAFPKGKALGRFGLLAYPATILGLGMSRLMQPEEPEAGPTPEERAAQADDVFANVNNEIANATASAQRDTAGIQQQYNNIFRELQKMYNLSETEEEKERLRFMLADIEAQRDAGLQAISEGYSKTVGDIQARAVKTRAETAERAGRYGAELQANRDQSLQRMIDQQAAQVAGARGLGSAAGQSPENEWVQLMSQYPGIQQRYTQRMGDISAEGIDWLADTTAAQGLAQQADLQRLAASTRSGVIAQQQQQVANRINAEREALRDAYLRLGMAGAAASQQNVTPLIDDLALREQIAALGGVNYSDRAIRNYFEPVVGRQLTPSELAVGAYEREQYLARQTAAAASQPVMPGQ